MKTIIFFTRKRARTPKMQGMATAAGSASVIRELCRMARCGKGRVYLVDAPTAEHGRRRIVAFRAGQEPDKGACLAAGLCPAELLARRDPDGYDAMSPLDCCRGGVADYSSSVNWSGISRSWPVSASFS